MNGSWRRVSAALIVAVIALGAIATSLQARPAVGGKFKLPFDAKWGIVALPAGDYTFSIDHLTENGSIFVYRGSHAVGIVRPQGLEGDYSHSQSSALLCIRHDGQVTVRALQLPHVGTFYFPMSKGLNTLVTQQPQLIETVSVQVSGE
jgi:hypothetical protein